MVLNRTRLIKESFDITFDDLFVRNTSHPDVTSHILESDSPKMDTQAQQVIININ